MGEQYVRLSFLFGRNKIFSFPQSTVCWEKWIKVGSVKSYAQKYLQTPAK